MIEEKKLRALINNGEVIRTLILFIFNLNSRFKKGIQSTSDEYPKMRGVNFFFFF